MFERPEGRHNAHLNRLIKDDQNGPELSEPMAHPV